MAIQGALHAVVFTPASPRRLGFFANLAASGMAFSKATAEPVPAVSTERVPAPTSRRKRRRALRRGEWDAGAWPSASAMLAAASEHRRRWAEPLELIEVLRCVNWPSTSPASAWSAGCQPVSARKLAPDSVNVRRPPHSAGSGVTPEKDSASCKHDATNSPAGTAQRRSRATWAIRRGKRERVRGEQHPARALPLEGTMIKKTQKAKMGARQARIRARTTRER